MNLTSQFFPGKIDAETSINYRRILQEKRKLRATVSVLRVALELGKKYRERRKSEKDEKLIESQKLEDEQKIDDVRRYYIENLMETKNRTFLKLVAKNWKSFKKPKSIPGPSDTSLPPKIQRESAKRGSTITAAHLPDRRNSLVTTDSDKVLLRLAMTLPPQVLTETGDKLSDLSTLMGFSSRNKMLRQRELSILQRPVLVDNRFVNLQNSLFRSATNHYN